MRIEFPRTDIVERHVRATAIDDDRTQPRPDKKTRIIRQPERVDDRIRPRTGLAGRAGGVRERSGPDERRRRGW